MPNPEISTSAMSIINAVKDELHSKIGELYKEKSEAPDILSKIVIQSRIEGIEEATEILWHAPYTVEAQLKEQ